MTQTLDEELVVLLTPDGEPCGSAPKRTVHAVTTPYHFAFSCYAFGADGRLLLTRRALEKRTWPGAWSNTCCGHPAPGEAVTDAVRRRLHHELGLRPTELVLALPDFSYRVSLDGVEENELCPVFLARIDDDPAPNPDEVADWAWVAWPEFLARARAGELSPWAALQAPALAPHVPGFLAA